MRPFFDTENFNLRILNALEKTDGFVRFTTLANDLKADRTTVRRHLQILQDTLTAFDENDISLETSRDSGVVYRRKASFDLGQVISVLAVHTNLSQLFESIFFEMEHKTSNYAAKHFISEASVRRLLKKLADALRPYQIKLVTRGLKLVGNEVNIRYAFFQYFWNTYGSISWPFRLTKKKAEEKSAQLQNSLNVKLDLSEQLKFLFWIGVSDQRNATNHFLKPDDYTKLGLAKDPEDDFLLGIMETDLLPEKQAIQPDEQIKTMVNHCPGMNEVLDEFISMGFDKFGSLNLELTKELKAAMARVYVHQRIFGNLPLLLGNNTMFKLQQKSPAVKLNIEPFYKELDQKFENWADSKYLRVMATILIQAFWPKTLCIKVVRYCLVLDCEPIERYQLSREIVQHFEPIFHVIEVSDDKEADLVITNLTVNSPHPKVFVNFPMNKQDWDHVLEAFDKIQVSSKNR